jgi:CheY-like chemotaxis protein
MGETTLFKGRRILVVEDEMMIAMLIEDMLSDFGCDVVGPAHDIDAALVLATQQSALDAAILDVNLAGKPVFAVADALRDIRVPMIFSTGYGEAGLRDADHGAPILQKPFTSADLERVLGEAFGRA